MPSRTSVATPTKRATEDDLRATPRDGRKYELVDGDIVVSPAGARHGKVCVNLVLALGNFVKEHALGQVLDSSTGFRLPGGNVRSPDVSFISSERLANTALSDDFSEVAPDLAVEVLSPGDRPRPLLDKIGEYLQSGVRLVWVIDPQRERAAVYRSLTDVRDLGLDDTLGGEDVVPGFACRLNEILE
jgi:Uma2 family endonuclease